MAHTMKERAEKTKQFIRDPDVTVVESFIHLVLWVRFEWAIIQRNKHATRARKLGRRLNTNLDIIKLRKDLNTLDK